MACVWSDHGKAQDSIEQPKQGGGRRSYVHNTPCSGTTPPNLPNHHGEHAVRLAIIAKAAIALFNCCRTRTSAALIAVALSGRAWPFLAHSVARFLPNPQHIAGPTISMSLDIIRLGPKETVAQLLKRLNQEQQDITQNTHCPLRILGHLDVEVRSMWVLARKQIFNWCPFAPTQLRNADGTTAFEVLVDEGSKVDEPMDEFIWRCGITDDKQLRIEVYASRELFEKSELENFVEPIFSFIDKLADVENWNKEVERVIPFGEY